MSSCHSEYRYGYDTSLAQGQKTKQTQIEQKQKQKQTNMTSMPMPMPMPTPNCSIHSPAFRGNVGEMAIPPHERSSVPRLVRSSNDVRLPLLHFRPVLIPPVKRFLRFSSCHLHTRNQGTKEPRNERRNHHSRLDDSIGILSLQLCGFSQNRSKLSFAHLPILGEAMGSLAVRN